VVRGYLLIPHAIQRTGQADASGAHDVFSQAAEIASRFADRDLAALAGHGRGRALVRMARIPEGVALLDEAMAAVVAGDVSPVLAGDIYCSVLAACHEILDVRRAHEWTTCLSQWCASQPDLVRYRGECLIYRAEIRQMRGAWTDAEHDAQEACALLSSPEPRPASVPRSIVLVRFIGSAVSSRRPRKPTGKPTSTAASRNPASRCCGWRRAASTSRHR
jgi:hypothetical protein